MLAVAFVCGAPGLGRAASAQASDSAAVLRAARRAQQAFERLRRDNLPEGRGTPGARCDARIGRFCYWYEPGTDAAPEEPWAIRDARGRLLAELADAAARFPGDTWIAGQRVRYLLDAGRADAAAAAARQCRAAGWWCAALRGLALQAAGDFPAAAARFDTALQAMPSAERCRWTDIAPLLDGEARAAYRALDCEARAAFAARWWWLAGPLWSSAANDRRTEHFARVTLARIMADGDNAYGLRWGDDLRELLLRYGPAVSWTFERPATALHDAIIAGHERAPSFRFGPAPHALAEPAEARPDDWDPTADAARERYAPPYAARFLPLAVQAALFRRGDSALVVAVYDVGRDTLFWGRAVHAALVLGTDGRRVAIAEHDTVAAGRDRLVATAPWAPLVLSLEVVAPRARAVARARFGLGRRETATPSLSDILLFAPGDSLPQDLAEALTAAYPAPRVPAGRPLGLFWEIAGLGPAAEGVPLTAAVSLAPAGGGRRSVELRWNEVLRPRGGVGARALVLDLAGVAPGRYRLALTVALPGADGASLARTAFRDIIVAPPAPPPR